MHIHVESGERHAKFWLDPVQLARSTGFNAKEIHEIRTLVTRHRDLITERWHDYFNG